MKKLLLVLGLIAITASCTPEEKEANYDSQSIEKDEIKDDDI